jgi:hypothetical protein
VNVGRAALHEDAHFLSGTTKMFVNSPNGPNFSLHTHAKDKHEPQDQEPIVNKFKSGTQRSSRDMRGLFRKNTADRMRGTSA